MSVPFADAFRNRRVLVTGHTGFKGSWLVLWLHALGARVYGYALPPPTHPSLFEAGRIGRLLARHTVGDVRDFDRLRRTLHTARPHYVFHLAAQAIVGVGYRQPRETFETNVLGTVNLLEALRTVRTRPDGRCAVIVVTSDKCYDVAATSRRTRSDRASFRETDRLGGDEPYSASKAAAELVVRAYRRCYFPPEQLGRHGVVLATVRAGNVIGGGDWATGRIIPDIVRSLAAGRPVLVRQPTFCRPWQHVLDPLGGYLQLAARLRQHPPPARDAALWEAWNFGPAPGRDVPVSDLVRRFLAAYGRGTWRRARVGPAVLPETARLYLSSAKARRLLGWRPRWTLDEAIRRTVTWYRVFYDQPHADLPAACREDIAAWEAAG